MLSLRSLRRAVGLLFVLLLAGGLLWTLPVTAATVTVRAGSVEGAAGDEVEIPIDVAEALEVGALRVDLTFDPDILEPLTVDGGDLTENALIEFNSDEPGRVVMGFVTLENVEGDGTVMVARFRVLGEAEQSTALGLENARAWEGDETRFDIAVLTEPGQFTVVEESAFPWLWIIIGLALLLVLLIVFWVSRRGRRPAPALAQAPAPAPAPAPVPTPAVAAPGPAAPTQPAGQGRFCGNCGASNVGHNLYCVGCGQWLPPPT